MTEPAEPYVPIIPPTTPRRRRWVIPLAAVLGLLLVGGGVGVITWTLTRRGGSPATAASPTTTTKVASVQQYAGIVNSTMKRMRNTWEDYRSRCLLVSEDDPICPILVMSLDTQASVLRLELSIAAKPDARGYIGAPPAEIAGLVEETARAAATVEVLIEDPETAPDGLVFRVVGDLVRLFDRWEPYI